jgi:hypothetical protein
MIGVDDELLLMSQLPDVMTMLDMIGVNDMLLLMSQLPDACCFLLISNMNQLVNFIVLLVWHCSSIS